MFNKVKTTLAVAVSAGLLAGCINIGSVGAIGSNVGGSANSQAGVSASVDAKAEVAVNGTANVNGGVAVNTSATSNQQRTTVNQPAPQATPKPSSAPTPQPSPTSRSTAPHRDIILTEQPDAQTRPFYNEVTLRGVYGGLGASGCKFTYSGLDRELAPGDASVVANSEGATKIWVPMTARSIEILAEYRGVVRRMSYQLPEARLDTAIVMDFDFSF